jgi:cyclopropane fatty-acyl-phospholipid synthase-like methyltransferase
MNDHLLNARFPRASRYHPDWVMEGAFGGNPLWLAEWLSEKVTLREGMRVLDLGCGRAKSSVFLAREFGVQVWATDLWISADENLMRLRHAGIEERVFPVHADARHLPFAAEFFDAILSLDSLQYYGTDDLYLNYLLHFLRPGGQLAMASAALVQELQGPVPSHLEQFWCAENWCLHTPRWWQRHWGRTGLVEVETSDLMPDGWQLWLAWAQAMGFDAWYRETLEQDAGRYLGYGRVVARRVAGKALPTRSRLDSLAANDISFDRHPLLRDEER